MSLEEQRIAMIVAALDEQITAFKVMLMSALERGDLTDEEIGNQILFLREIIDGRKVELPLVPFSKAPDHVKPKITESIELAIEAATRELDWLLTLPLEAS